MFEHSLDVAPPLAEAILVMQHVSSGAQAKAAPWGLTLNKSNGPPEIAHETELRWYSCAILKAMETTLSTNF
jgi:hypothetical protein